MSLVAAAAFIGYPHAVPMGAAGCDGAATLNGGCASAGNNGNSITLYGSKNTGGSGKGTSGSKGKKADPCAKLTLRPCDFTGIIPPGAPGNPGVTISDLKNFVPTPGTDHMEPNGWLIVGLNTNFYSIVGVEIKTGTLLGNPASVRFTPESWHWTYGDGTGATRATAGRTWAAEHIAEFDPTPTSHVYTAPGTYDIDLDITFRAEYRYNGGPWLPVAGTLTLPANRLKATAGSAKTVLVNRNCVQNPSGPGC